jgi:hypothetical protein
MSSAKSASKAKEARGHGATTTQEKFEPNRLSGRRCQRKKNGWRIRGTKKRLEKIQGAVNKYIFVSLNSNQFQLRFELRIFK